MLGKKVCEMSGMGSVIGLTFDSSVFCLKRRQG